ncbi:LamG-like jellyroll fold domain-containing protein [Pseudarthrobacter phenanthrenivorans]|uniref:LamG-like jellyroll fold domain-containing protein n=1 Tax=Pseudarthrobacter phenanthrenivorans TaxID=361575 RepID=UPI00344EDD3B
MDVVTLGMAKADAAKQYSKTASIIIDASTIPGGDGTLINGATDQSGHGNDLTTIVASTRPTLRIENGKKHIACGGTSWLFNVTNEQWPQPNTLVGVVRLASGAISSFQVLFGSVTGSRNNVRVDTTGTPQIHAGSAGATGGAPLNDGQWHVIVAVLNTTGSALYVDGYLVASTSSQTQGSESMLGAAIGSDGTSTNAANVDVREYRVIRSALTAGKVRQITAELGAKWGITVGRTDAPATYLQTTSSNGQAIRVWAPAPALRGTTTPLVIWCHPHTHSEQVSPGYFVFPHILALVNKGYAVAASNMHGDNWGNTNGINDLKNLYDYANAQFNVSKVVLIGGSMGGVASSLAVPDGQLPNLKGVVGIDAVYSLAALYANGTYTSSIDTAYGITRGTLSGATSAGATTIPTTASFPTVGTQLVIGNGTANREIVTTTAASTGSSVAVTATTKAHASSEQVSDYPTKTAGHDPLLRAGSDYTGVRWRFYASPNDTSVNKAANTDAMASLLAAAPEKTVVAHTGTHLAGTGIRPADLVAFVDRCFA